MNFTDLILSAMAALIALTIHEYAHGFAAYKLGDPTAKSMGRLSLNPLSHLDPLGTLCMVLFHFGWAKPVPINARYFKNPKKGFAITALAGPITNLAVAFLTSFVYVLCANIFRYTEIDFVNILLLNTLKFIFYFFVINVGLGVFNLIPVPPFDGSRILNVILPSKWYFKIMKYERQIYWGVMAWLFIGGYVYIVLTKIPFIGNNTVLSALAKIFSLSDIINDMINAIANGMIKLWSALPFFK